MAFTYALGAARTSSTSNPISFSYTVAAGDSVVCLMLKVNGATDRAGGSPTLGSAYTFTQSGITQKAASTPEASTELWYVLNPAAANYTLTIPNTGALTVFYVIGIGRVGSGGRAMFSAEAGTNGTSANPATGTVQVGNNGNIIFATAASGAQTWAPSAQTGTVIQNTDDGAHGGGTQYLIQNNPGSTDMTWTQASDDWGAVAACFSEVAAHNLNNYQAVKAGDTISVTEKIR